MNGRSHAKDQTPHYDYARLIAEEKEHYSRIEVTDELTEGGGHAQKAWEYYWARVADEISSAPFASLGRYLETRYADIGRTVRVLSLGSGYCGKEIRLARGLECPYKITCTDINADLFSAARQRVRAEGLQIGFEIEDLNFMEIDSSTYDVVLAEAALHHVINLEMLFEQVATGLAPGGSFHIVEVIGKNRAAIWAENLAFANAALDALPRDVIEGYKINAPNTREEGMEGIRQEDIVPVLEDWFDSLYEYRHGAFMRFICTNGRLGQILNPDEPRRRRYLDFLIDVDRSAVRNGVLRPLELWGVYRPKLG